MTDTRTGAQSLTSRTRPLDAGGAIVAAHFLGETAAFVLGEETILLASADGSEQRVAAHDGGILSSASDGKRIVTGGDDGKIVASTADGKAETLATDEKRRWIDHVASGPDGAVAWSSGKTVFARNAKGEIKSADIPSSAGGLTFAPKGFRIAVAHYNGVSLWFPNAAAKPEFLEWKGVHYTPSFSPDGKFIVTCMQEPMLHGWRVADSKHMRMSGYSARVRSLSWSADGGWLATGGSEQIILWPFKGKDGPMGQQPRLLAPSSARVGVVACHPKQDVVAAGFADGMVLLVRMSDAAEILARRPGDAPVTALAFTSDGERLAFGCEDGSAGIVDLA
jgi:WD40 repeat protein